MLDSTDVNMWYKMGKLALRKASMPLARHAFEVGLRCNPDHWPCLDSLITVLYALSDYSCESETFAQPVQHAVVLSKMVLILETVIL